MIPAPDDIDWAMGELLHLIGRATDLGTVPWHLDHDWYWACMRAVYAQEPEEQARLIRMLLDARSERAATVRYSANDYARAR